jgi:hypothetical protein
MKKRIKLSQTPFEYQQYINEYISENSCAELLKVKENKDEKIFKYDTYLLNDDKCTIISLFIDDKLNTNYQIESMSIEGMDEFVKDGRLKWEFKNKNNLSQSRIGQVRKNRNGSLMEVVEYYNANDILVAFIGTGGKPVRTSWLIFCKGKVRNVYDKTVHGVGYIGDGEFKVSENGKSTNMYRAWFGMIQRCYSPKVHEKLPTYKGCTVSEEWLNFQNFAAWYDQNYYEVYGERTELDKDILVKGNKIYSSDTCIFVPQTINIMFVKNDASRGTLPIGVRIKGKKYYAACNNGTGKSLRSVLFYTLEEAFYAYKNMKEQLIKQTADKYKDSIPTKLYDAMFSYKVDIND